MAPWTWLASALLAATGGTGEEALISWAGRRIHLSSLPSELPESARSALEAWGGWCQDLHYRLDLDGPGRVLLVSRQGNSRVDIQMVLASAVVERFDSELHAPAERLTAGGLAPPAPAAAGKAGAGSAPPARKPLPEDPEGDEPHPWKLEPSAPKARETQTWTTTWGAADTPLDTQTIVLFIVVDQKDFERLLAHLGQRFDYLKKWSEEAKAYQGFVLGEPLAGAYLERPDGVEEWDPDHELVNRLARLCLLRRFGEAPNWFVQGYAWHMEFALQGSVYCFPWRDEFVGVGEHTGWDVNLKNWYGRTRLEVVDFASWPRGVYRDHEAQTSWGVVEYLLARERDKAPSLLEALRLYRDEHGRIQEGPGNWRRDLDYEIPHEEQKKLLVEHLGPDFLTHVTFFFREGMASVPR